MPITKRIDGAKLKSRNEIKGKRNHLEITISIPARKVLEECVQIGRGGHASAFIEVGINLLALIFSNDINSRKNKEILKEVIRRIIDASPKPHVLRWNVKVILDEINRQFNEKTNSID